MISTHYSNNPMIFLYEHKVLQQMVQPPQSSDINIIESVWDNKKRQKQLRWPKSIEQLQQYLQGQPTCSNQLKNCKSVSRCTKQVCHSTHIENELKKTSAQLCAKRHVQSLRNTLYHDPVATNPELRMSLLTEKDFLTLIRKHHENKRFLQLPPPNLNKLCCAFNMQAVSQFLHFKG